MKSFAIGTNEAERFSVAVLNYERPVSGDFHDDNWLLCQVAIGVGAFRAKYNANFLTSELDGLLTGLSDLHRDLRGEYTFDPLEAQLVFRASCDNLGHIRIVGEAMDRAGIGHQLRFEFSIDQTYLTSTLQDLSDVMQSFPVRA